VTSTLRTTTTNTIVTYVSTGLAWLTATTTKTDYTTLTDRTTITSIITSLIKTPPSLGDFQKNPYELANWYVPVVLAIFCGLSVKWLIPEIKNRRKPIQEAPPKNRKQKREDDKKPPTGLKRALAFTVGGFVAGLIAQPYTKPWLGDYGLYVFTALGLGLHIFTSKSHPTIAPHRPPTTTAPPVASQDQKDALQKAKEELGAKGVI